MPNVPSTTSRRSQEASYADQPPERQERKEEDRPSSASPSQKLVCDLNYYRQLVQQPSQPIGPASPVTSPHCVENTAHDVWRLIQSLQNQTPAQMEALLAQVVDHGDQDIRLSVPLAPGSYSDDMEVRGGGMVDVHLHIHDGKISGSLEFRPGLIKRNPSTVIFGRRVNLRGFEAEITRIDISTNGNNQLNFDGHVNVFGFDRIERINLDMTKTLFGHSEATIQGPASHVLARIIQYYGRLTPAQLQARNLVDPTGARFRVDINPSAGEAALAPLGRQSHARVRLPRIDLGNGVTVSDISADISATPNGMTGMNVSIADAHIGEIRHYTEAACSTSNAPTPDAIIRNLRVQNTNAKLVFIENAQHRVTRAYVQTAQGQLIAGTPTTPTVDLHGDVVLAALSEPIRFSVTEGSADGHAVLEVQHPNLTLARADLQGNIPTLPATATGEDLINALKSMFNGEQVDSKPIRTEVAQAGLEPGHIRLTIKNIFDLAHTTYAALFPDRPLVLGVDRVSVSGPILADYNGKVTNARLSLGQPNVTVNIDPDNNVAFRGTLGLDARAETRVLDPHGTEVLRAGLGDLTCSSVSFNGHASDVLVHVGLNQCALRKTTTDAGANHGSLSGSGINTTIDYDSNGLIADVSDFSLFVGGRSGPRDHQTTGAVQLMAAASPTGGRGIHIAPGTTDHTYSVKAGAQITGEAQVPNMGRVTLNENLTASVGLEQSSILRVLGLEVPLFMPQAGQTRVAVLGSGTVGHRRHTHQMDFRDEGHGRLRAHVTANSPGLGSTDLTLTSRLLGVGSQDPHYNLFRVSGTHLSLSGNLRNGHDTVALGGEAHETWNRTGIHHRGHITASANHLNIPRLLRSAAGIHLPNWLSAATASLAGVPASERARPQPVRAEFSGTNANLRVTTLPARLAVDTTMTTVFDGHPLRIRIHGHLDTAALSINTSPRHVTLATTARGETPQLTGKLTVSLMGPHNENYGEASVDADAVLQATQTVGRGGPANVTHVALRARVNQPIALPGASVTIPAGSTLTLPIRHLPMQVTERGGGRRTVDLAFPDIDRVEFAIPNIRLAGFGGMRNLSGSLSLTADGQRWSTDLDPRGLARLEAVPGANGTLNPARLSLRLQGEASEPGAPRPELVANLNLRTTSTRESRNAAGEEVHDITGIDLGLTVDGQAPSPSNALINLHEISVTSPLGNIQFVRNPANDQVHLQLPTSSFTRSTLPTSYEDWAHVSATQWNDIITRTQQGSHTLVFDNLERIPSLTDIFPLPAGAGKVFVDLNAAGVADLARPQSPVELAQTLRRVILEHAYREFPNPPARTGNGPAVIYNNAQRPGTGGTVFFLRQANAAGQSEFADSHWAARFASETNIPRDTVDGWITNGRVEMTELVQAIRRSVGDAFSPEAIQGFVVSYLREEEATQSTGTQFRHSPDMLSLAIGQLRQVAQAMPRDGRVVPVDQAISDPYFFAPDGTGTIRPGHFDGSCNQVTGFVAIPPQRALEFLRNNPDADNWLSSVSRTGNTVTASLFGRYSVTAATSEHSFGPVLTYHLHRQSGEVAGWTRTVRLIPISHNGIQGTLVHWTEYIDAPGDETANAHVPEMEHRADPAINFATFSDSLLGALPQGSRAVTPEPFAMDRITHMLSLMNDTGTTPLTYSSTAEPTRVFSNVSLLRFNAEAGTIEIPEDVPQAQLESAFRAVGVPQTMSSQWIAAHQVNIDQYLEATGLTAMGRNLFMDQTRIIFRDTHIYSSPVERWFLMTKDFQRLYQTAPNTVLIRIMRDARFTRASYTVEPTATRDPANSEMYVRLHLPAGRTLTPEQWIATMHQYHRHHEWAPEQFSPGAPMTVETVGGRSVRRIPTDLNVPMAGHSFYHIHSPPNPETLTNGELFSEWSTIPGTQSGANVRIQFNSGYYAVGADLNGDLILRRGNVIDTNMSDLTGPAAAEARVGVVKHFGWITSMAFGQDREAVRFTLGATIDENGQPVN